MKFIWTFVFLWLCISVFYFLKCTAPNISGTISFIKFRGISCLINGAQTCCALWTSQWYMKKKTMLKNNSRFLFGELYFIRNVSVDIIISFIIIDTISLNKKQMNCVCMILFCKLTLWLQDLKNLLVLLKVFVMHVTFV